ncbi:MAG: hypothetical protein FWF52_02395 [Candidatus Azobacteroides sp.]|nr:hypothetical protein [Candidatus Azobacteroides sp.]
MKKIILLSVFVLVCFCVNAEQKCYVYCELVGTSKLFSSKVNVQADFGQQTSFWKGVDYLKDENGKKIVFNSMVDAMNFMGTQGWEFVQAYVITSGQQNVYHWLLKKEITAEEQEKLKESIEQ